MSDAVAQEASLDAAGPRVLPQGDASVATDGGPWPDAVDPAWDAPAPPKDQTGPELSRGIPFGPYNLYGGGGAGPSSWDTPLSVGTDAFNMSSDYLEPSGTERRLASARARTLRLLTHMTGGDHNKYISNGVFDLAKWKAAMSAYDTPQLRAAIAAAVADGTIVANSVMDEPHHESWGGALTKRIVDEMCAYVKGIFPTLPVGPAHGHDDFEPSHSYAVCDVLIDQYAHRKTLGDVTSYRDRALAMARRDGHAILFSLNILDGGIQDKDGAWQCSTSTTGGQGTYAPNCRMTSEQVRTFGETLGRAGCGLTMWRYDLEFMSSPSNQEAFRHVASVLNGEPAKPCIRAPVP